jgi:hypothetical protein
MRIDWAIPCKYAEVNGSLLTIVGAQVDTVRVSEFPMRLRTWVAMRLVFGEEEAGGEHSVVFRMLDPSMRQIGEHTANVNFGSAHPEKQPGWEANHVMALQLGFDATGPGTHTFELYVDDRHQRTLPFSVRSAVDELA